MGLSQWPKKFTRPDPVESGNRSDFVQAFFETDEVYVDDGKGRLELQEGMVVEWVDSHEGNVKVSLIGEINHLGGVCDDCTFGQNEDISRWAWLHSAFSCWLADEKGLDY